MLQAVSELENCRVGSWRIEDDQFGHRLILRNAPAGMARARNCNARGIVICGDGGGSEMHGTRRRLTCGTIVVALQAGWHTAPSALTSAQASRAPAPARETLADLPGARLWYHDTGGSGVPVVLLHAATGSSRVWEHQIPAFTARG